VNWLAGAVVLLSASLYVNVKIVPVELMAADWKTGGTPTGVTGAEAADGADVLSPFKATDVKV
jgi:hypothetical protein